MFTVSCFLSITTKMIGFTFFCCWNYFCILLCFRPSSVREYFKPGKRSTWTISDIDLWGAWRFTDDNILGETSFWAIRFQVNNLLGLLSCSQRIVKTLIKKFQLKFLKTTYDGLFNSKLAFVVEVWGCYAHATYMFRLLKRAIRTLIKNLIPDSCQ